ncbi:MAG: class I SAM-dependent methyltransferase [bacterium]|nr:class I SAM-dependent methyltransferase [bacterium]
MIDTRKLTRWYDFQARFYSLWRDSAEHPLIEEVDRALSDVGGERRVLDAACGTGLFGVGLARKHPGWCVHGLDMSFGMLQVARDRARRLGADNVVFQRGDVTRIPFRDGAFDIVVSAGLLPHLNAPQTALEQYRRILAPGGRLIVVEFDRDSMSLGTNVVFRTLMLGYKVISTVLPRFRYTRRWSAERSLIDRDAFEEQARRAGLTQEFARAANDHLLFRYSVADGAAR